MQFKGFNVFYDQIFYWSYNSFLRFYYIYKFNYVNNYLYNFIWIENIMHLVNVNLNKQFIL